MLELLSTLCATSLVLGSLGRVSHYARYPAPTCALPDAGGALTALGGSLARVSQQQRPAKWLREGESFVQLPPGTPWGCVHFVGGAGLGSAPSLCYDALLSALAMRTGVAVIATPFDLGVDHWAASRVVASRFDVARDVCVREYGLSPAAPTFRLGHSLGAKLLVIAALETGSLKSTAAAFGKLGLVAFNNFELKDSAALAAQLFASSGGGDAFGEGGEEGDEGGRGEAVRKVVSDAFSIAQTLGGMAGVAPPLEVTPSPDELLERVAADFACETAVFSFENDQLDSAAELLAAMPSSVGSQRTTLPGTHTSPVAFRLSVADIDPALAALLGTAGGRAVTVGDPATAAPLADALCGWIWPAALGAPPTLGAAPAEDD